jgi:hypothetical protein
MPASPATKVTDKTHILCFAVPTFASTTEENEASSSSFSNGMIPRCKPAMRVGRFNYYVVKRGYNVACSSIGLIVSVR